MKRSILALAALLAVAPSMPSFSKDNPDREYRDLVKRARAGDAGVDYAALRSAYTRTRGYSPHADHDKKPALTEALEEEDFAKVARLADVILKDRFVDGNTHIVAVIANERLGRFERADWHREIVTRLAGSICPEGSGRTAEAPCRVHAVSEEYFYFNANGLDLDRKIRTGPCGESICDVMRVTPRKGEPFELYFDVSASLEWLSRKLGD